jgi:HAD superfamily hydrolase (TIGR01509 family)
MNTPTLPTLRLAGHTVRAALFDMDGVIADTRAAHAAAWEIFLRRHGIAEDPEAFLVRVFGLGNREIFSMLHPERAHDLAFLDAMGDEKESLFLDQLAAGRVELVPGVRAMLAHLNAAGIPVALGSSAPRQNVDGVLDRFSLRQHFQAIVTGSDVPRAKPDPAIFLRCCELLAVDGPDAVVFEDSRFGLEAARRARCRVVGLATTHPRGEIAPLCDAVADDFHGVLSLLG